MQNRSSKHTVETAKVQLVKIVIIAKRLTASSRNADRPRHTHNDKDTHTHHELKVRIS